MKSVATMLAIGFLIVLASYVVRDYNTRMDTLNHHICVDVYGLDENCN